MTLKDSIYYSYGAFMGALVALATGVCYITLTERYPDVMGVWIAVSPILLIAYISIREEFKLVDNNRATGFTLIMFVSGLISVIATLHFLGGAS